METPVYCIQKIDYRLDTHMTEKLCKGYLKTASSLRKATIANNSHTYK